MNTNNIPTLLHPQPSTLTFKRKKKGRAARRRYCKSRSIQDAIRCLFQHDYVHSQGKNDSTGEPQPPKQQQEQQAEQQSKQGVAVGTDARTKVGGEEQNNFDPTFLLPGVKIRRLEWDSKGGRNSGKTMETNSFIDRTLLTSQLGGFLPNNFITVSSRISHVSTLYPHLTQFLLQQQQRLEQEQGTQPVPRGDGETETWDPIHIPTTVMLYPLVVRKQHEGGKVKGTNCKARKRGGHSYQTRSNISTEDGMEIETPNTPSIQNTQDREYIIEPFPTLYWLTHPILKILISQLEETHIRILEHRLHSQDDYLQQMKQSHEQYGQQRQALVTLFDWKNIVLPRQWTSAIGASRGIAGIRKFPQAIKCLHCHAAHYLATLANSNSTSRDHFHPASSQGVEVKVVEEGEMKGQGKRIVEEEHDVKQTVENTFIPDDKQMSEREEEENSNYMDTHISSGLHHNLIGQWTLEALEQLIIRKKQQAENESENHSIPLRDEDQPNHAVPCTCIL